LTDSYTYTLEVQTQAFISLHKGEFSSCLTSCN